MATLGLCLCGGLAVALCLLIGIFLRLVTLPATLRALARRERAEAQAEAMGVLQEQAAAMVGPITASLRAHEEEAAARHRDELGAAEVRARMAERRAADVAPILEVASELARNLRQLADDLGWAAVQVAEQRGKPPPMAPVATHPELPAPGSDARATPGAKPPASCASPPPPPASADGDFADDEHTKVGRWADLELAPADPPVGRPSRGAAGLDSRPPPELRTSTLVGPTPSPQQTPSRRATPTLVSRQAPPPPTAKGGEP